MSTPEHERRNRAFWDADADTYQERHAEQFERELCAWGVWAIPERELGLLGDVAGRDVLELGCGSAQWSVGLARRGARPVGLDQSAAQLAHAARRVTAAGVPVPLVQASATAAPFAAESFDLVFCDHGAMSFCDPALTVPEVARVLRPGGRLVFSHTTRLVYLTYDERRDRFSRKLRKVRWGQRIWPSDAGTTDYCVTTGEWLRLFAAHGLVPIDLVELRAPKRATTTFEGWPPKWARRWPAEQVWIVERRRPEQ